MTGHEDLTLTDTSASSEASCCGHTPNVEAVAETPVAQMAECPVMAGSPVVKADAEAAGLYRDYKDRRYWLCCAACGPLFDADPDRYTRSV